MSENTADQLKEKEFREKMELFQELDKHLTNMKLHYDEGLVLLSEVRFQNLDYGEYIKPYGYKQSPAATLTKSDKEGKLSLVTDESQSEYLLPVNEEEGGEGSDFEVLDKDDNEGENEPKIDTSNMTLQEFMQKMSERKGKEIKIPKKKSDKGSKKDIELKQQEPKPILDRFTFSTNHPLIFKMQGEFKKSLENIIGLANTLSKIRKFTAKGAEAS